MTATTPTTVSLQEAEQFLYQEARLADEHRYEAWEALWTDDAIYWVPAGDPEGDPERSMSVIYDNRARIATRIRQLETGTRHSQTPRSSLRRLVSNIEILGEHEGDVVVGANVLVIESRPRGTTLWGGRNEYRLRRVGDELRMAAKKVVLVDHDRALSTLSFLI